MATSTLLIGLPVTLNAQGTGQVSLGPDQGQPYWHVTGVVLQTNRPNASPVPVCQIYLDDPTAGSSLGLTSNGSWKTASCDQMLSRGQHIIAVWTGGQAGDVATMTLSGTKADTL